MTLSALETNLQVPEQESQPEASAQNIHSLPKKNNPVDFSKFMEGVLKGVERLGAYKTTVRNGIIHVSFDEALQDKSEREKYRQALSDNYAKEISKRTKMILRRALTVMAVGVCTAFLPTHELMHTKKGWYSDLTKQYKLPQFSLPQLPQLSLPWNEDKTYQQQIYKQSQEIYQQPKQVPQPPQPIYLKPVRVVPPASLLQKPMSLEEAIKEHERAKSSPR